MLFSKNGTATDLVSLVPPTKGKSLFLLLFNLDGTLWLLIGENRQKGHWVTSKSWPLKVIRLLPGSSSGLMLGAQPCTVGDPEHLGGGGFRLAAHLHHQCQVSE